MVSYISRFRFGCYSRDLRNLLGQRTWELAWNATRRVVVERSQGTRCLFLKPLPSNPVPTAHFPFSTNDHPPHLTDVSIDAHISPYLMDI